jgi:hypothetical protein
MVVIVVFHCHRFLKLKIIGFIMDTFFRQTNCDRCNSELSVRKMSWFNEDTLCMDCIDKEKLIRSQLPENGRTYEGCGYIPNYGA